MNSCIYSGLHWLSTSGIQDESGGVARYYSADTREYTNVSAESTAYYISTLLRAVRDLKDENPPEEALRAGSFLMEQAFDMSSELFLFELGDKGRPPARLAYFLDCSFVIRALLDLWKASGNAAYLECTERCGLALQTRMSKVDGSFFPVYDLSCGEPHVGTETWSVETDVYQLKGGLAFLELTEATGARRFQASMESMLRWCLDRHEAFVFANSDPQKLIDRLHAYCYFLEGLLPSAERDMAAGQALQYGLLKVESLMEDVRADLQRCDVIAQLLRLRIYADKFGVMELDYQQAESEAAALVEFQLQSTDPKVDGGFALARRGDELVPQLNLAAATFAIQALQMWEQAEEGTFREPWQTLI